MSSSLLVLSDIPLGTALGLILFLVYYNDMPYRISKDSKIRLFVDDSILFREIKTIKDAEKLQEDLNELQIWEK